MTLDRLWAGWRSEYIDEVTAGDKPAGGGSVFTRILASGLPDDETHIVWRGWSAFAILSRSPYISGHVLVMRYREVSELEGLTADERAELWSAVTAAAAAIKAAYTPDGLNIGMNLGTA